MGKSVLKGSLFNPLEESKWAQEEILERENGVLERHCLGEAEKFPREHKGEACSGVYFLYSGSRVIYVGQSQNVAVRLFVHKRNQAGEFQQKFDSFSWKRFPEDRLNFMEAHYIWKLRPRYNRTLPSNNCFLGPKKFKKYCKERLGRLLTAEERKEIPPELTYFMGDNRWAYYDAPNIILTVPRYPSLVKIKRLSDAQ